MDPQGWGSQRQKTAIGRSDLSAPVRQALADGLFQGSPSVLDYGCGRGQDVARLRQLGHEAVGWDPHFASDVPLGHYQLVFLTYVLNVIEEPVERQEALRNAWRHCTGVLAVSVRLTWDQRRVRGSTMGDGTLTSRETFQHLYAISELRHLVSEVTDVHVVSPRPGTVYAFRSAQDRLGYLARDVSAGGAFGQETSASTVEALLAFARRHGRAPKFEEVPAAHMPELSVLSTTQLRRLISTSLSPAELEGGTRRATLDTILFLAMALFEGRGRLADMPLAVQENVRAHFASYRQACQRADRLLIKLRDDTYLRGAMRNSVGKLTPTALYVHSSATSQMPIALRLYEHCGAVAAGRPAGWNILKLNHSGRRVAWSAYPDFETDPHPRLAWTYGVSLETLEADMQDFSTRQNRPLLHRKHEFLAADHPDVPKYQRLTLAEVRHGLYEDPARIGLEEGWEAELARCGVELRGHRLIRRTS
jgi:DNA phosphorothioation-associated putative methyltransferase